MIKQISMMFQLIRIDDLDKDTHYDIEVTPRLVYLNNLFSGTPSRIDYKSGTIKPGMNASLSVYHQQVYVTYSFVISLLQYVPSFSSYLHNLFSDTIF